IHPIVKAAVAARQVAGGGAGAGREVAALVHIAVHGQAVVEGSFALKLPVAYRAVLAFGVAIQGTFLEN
nr:hypothetical protein [Tanacetum cinerariifolium]